MTHRMERGLTTLSRWFDDGQDRDEGQMWHRCAKVAEEAGEVIDAIIGWTGRNPRKGKCKTQADVEKELLDTAMAALGAVEHLHGNPDHAVSLRLLERHVAGLIERAGLTLVEDLNPMFDETRTCPVCGDEPAYCGGPEAHRLREQRP